MARAGPAVGSRQSPEHKAALSAKLTKIRRAKKKLGLAWGEPLPADHPLAKGSAKAKPKKAHKEGPAKELTPKQAYQLQYRAKQKALLAKGDPAALAVVEVRRARQREWWRAKRAAKHAGLPVPVKTRKNGHANGEVIHDLLPIGKGSISVAQVMARGTRHGALPPGVAAGSRAERVMGLFEAWTLILREELAKE